MRCRCRIAELPGTWLDPLCRWLVRLAPHSRQLCRVSIICVVSAACMYRSSCNRQPGACVRSILTLSPWFILKVCGARGVYTFGCWRPLSSAEQLVWFVEWAAHACSVSSNTVLFCNASAHTTLPAPTDFRAYANATNRSLVLPSWIQSPSLNTTAWRCPSCSRRPFTKVPFRLPMSKIRTSVSSAAGTTEWS